jgi:hypothetical protein
MPAPSAACHAMTRASFHHLLTPILLLALVASPAAAASKSKGKPTIKPIEVAYRCKTPEGRTLIGQAIPPECMDLDVEALDEQGQVVRRIHGAAALAVQVEEKKRIDELARQKEIDAQRDRTLLATYLSVADIERLRDQRIELLEQQSQVTRQYIGQLRERETRLKEDVRRFRPYSDKSSAPALPDHVAEDIVNTVNGLQVYEQQLATTTVEQERLRTTFDGEIQRFKELKGLN